MTVSRSRAALDPAEQPKPAPRQEQTRQDARREFIDLIKLALVFLVVFWVMKSFVIEGYEVQGDSMAPTLEDRDRILVFKLPHQLSRLPVFDRMPPFRPSDMIVFDGEGGKRYIKRIVALNPGLPVGVADATDHQAVGAGQHEVKVEFDHGVVRVNNWQIDESAYLPETARTDRDHDVRMLLPGEYYVMGDHRQVSRDSRSFGPINDAQIVGRAVLRFWPLHKFGLL